MQYQINYQNYINLNGIAKHTKVDMIWVAGRNPTLVSHSLRGVAMNLKATTLTYLAILDISTEILSRFIVIFIENATFYERGV